ncbi:hypothetical protein FI667_g5842, partial [Globisporangium splendens]
MYTIVYSAESKDEGFVFEKDYMYLLEHMEGFNFVPKKLFAAFEECQIPVGGALTNANKSSAAFAASIKPALDPHERRPASKRKTGHFSSFDFIGGEDSGEDSDELYDSDQISEMEEFAGSFHENGHSDTHEDASYSSSKMGIIISNDDEDRQTSRAAPPTPPFGGGDHPGFNRNSSRSSASSSSLRSRGVQKMSRNIGKAVGGGISKVGRSILHVGKSQVHNNGPPKSTATEPDPGAASLLAAGYLFSSDSQMSKNYVCGYLHKMSDGKWSKRSWHRRWFVLDRQQGILSYYRYNPANLISASPHGNIIHMDDNETETSTPAPSAQCSQEQGHDDPSASGGPGQEARRSIDENAKDAANGNKISAEVDHNGHQEKSQQNLLYMNKSHPWYRGEFDLNLDNVSLLFEKSLAKSAPTSYFFQVSTLSLHDIDSKRGVQYKLCADNEADYDLWTHAISTAINRKHTLAVPRDGGMEGNRIVLSPVLSHQQLYRQRLLQEQQLRHDKEECPSSAVSTPTLSVGDLSSPSGNNGGATTSDVVSETKPAASPPKPNLPPIITHFPSPIPAHSNWRLEVTVDGTKQCMILGFVVNMIALKCLAPEHVVGKFFVCITVTVGYVLSIYNPVPRYGLHPGFGQERRRSGSTGLFHDDSGVHRGVDAAVLSTDVTQCADPSNCCMHRGVSSSGTAFDDSDHLISSGVSYGGIPVGRVVKKFLMGSSMTRTEMLESGRSTNVPHSWSTARGETFAIRSIDYKKTKRKEASLPALFEFIGCDLIRTGGKVDLISQRVELPEEYANEKIFIINAQLPSYAPSVWGDASSDGPGFSLVLYWKIPKEVHEELKNPSTPALRLLKRFLNAGNDTSLTDRFKVIAQVTNQDECGITGMGKKLLASHNSTPVLTRPQHRIYHFNEGSTEIVVDIHAFSYIARRGIHLLLDKTSKLVIDIGFVLQGETEDELPEQILGCCRLDHADVQRAMDMPT